MKFTALLVLAITMAFSFAAMAAETKPVPAFFELRTYHAAEGKFADLLARFRNHTLKLFEKHGITNIGYWIPTEEKDGAQNTLVYLLAYPSAEAREMLWKEFINDPEWKAAAKASEVNGKLVAKVESVYLAPTAYSMFNVELAAANRTFELRTYTTPDGKLDALHQRFSGHTIELFKKYGMTNILYTTPIREKDGAGHKLIYLLAHKDKAAQAASFAAFRADPEWIKIKAESEKDGSLTEKENGVVSLLLTATDFSPLK
jgi:NIPSNAP